MIHSPIELNHTPDWIQKSPPVSIQDRLNIYRHAYQIRITESMQEDFPAVLEAMGPVAFEICVKDYLNKFPSKYWTLARVGQNFPRFLNHCSKFKSQPFLGELAQFEWLRVVVERTSQSPRSDFTQFYSLSLDSQMRANLTLDPSVQLMRSQWDIPTYVESTLRGNTPLSKRTRLLLYKNKNHVKYATVSPTQWTFLKGIQNTQTIQQLLNRIPNREVTNFGLWMASWTQAGIIVGFTLPENN